MTIVAPSLDQSVEDYGLFPNSMEQQLYKYEMRDVKFGNQIMCQKGGPIILPSLFMKNFRGQVRREFPR